MKVKDFMKKVNIGTLKLPVYLQEGHSGTPREANNWDFMPNDYYAKEHDRTLQSISILTDKVIVYYS